MNIEEDKKYWGGLVYINKAEHKKGNAGGLLDGSTYSNYYWHYAVAPFSLYSDGTYPAYGNVKESALWMRVEMFHFTCKQKAYRNNSGLIILTLIFIAVK